MSGSDRASAAGLPRRRRRAPRATAQRPVAAPARARLRRQAAQRHGALRRAARSATGFQTGHHVVVREECEIGDDVSIWSNTVIDYGCRIGDRVKIHSNCYVAQFTEIEDDAFLAPGRHHRQRPLPGRRRLGAS